MAYTFQRGALRNLTVTAGMQNIFNQYQDDFDLGADRDAGYVYGPMRPRTVTFGVRYRVEPPHPADRQKP
jgi:outer membrane receptor for ferrienterochelin and colicins